MRGQGALFGARLASLLRAGAGARVEAIGRRPERPLELFEFEACPFCRRVREALTRLDLEVLVRPCPKGGARNRSTLLALGGVEQFPFLVDPNTGRQMYESSDIVAYLDDEYGAKDAAAAGAGAADALEGAGAEHARARRLRKGALGRLRRSTPALVLSGLGRGSAGSRARRSRAASAPLVFYGFEAQAESRLVREVLCELELDYLSRPLAPGSAFRTVDRGGEVEAPGRTPGESAAPTPPTLVDPNLGLSKTGWRAIVEHLEASYALG